MPWDPPDRCERAVQSSAVTTGRTGEATFWGRIVPYSARAARRWPSTPDSAAHEGYWGMAHYPTVRDRCRKGTIGSDICLIRVNMGGLASFGSDLPR